MKTAGIALLWIGVVAFLKNLGIIQVIDWSIIWPVILIIAGTSLRHCDHSMMCAVGGKCGMCGMGKNGNGDGHKCEGAGCGSCK